MKKPFQFLAFLPLFTFIPLLGFGSLDNQLPSAQIVLAKHTMPLNDRQENSWVNEIFKDNILLALSYMSEITQSSTSINWQLIHDPFSYTFKLEPNQTFAFHEDVLDKYQGKIAKTTNAHFNIKEGFKSDGFLAGDGVCHLASLMDWAAKDAGLEVEAPISHDFARIPDIPNQFGVSIYSFPGAKLANARENLYITNNKSREVVFKFEYQNDNLKLSVLEQ